MMDLALLRISQIRTDGGTQTRVQTDQETVEEYAEAKSAGCAFAPIVVFKDSRNRYWLADGFHRLAAYLLSGCKTIEADVRKGELREAILFAVGCNRKHGLRRSNEDKRKALDILLADPEWSKLPNTEIAELCGISEGLVRIRRRELETSYNTRPAKPSPRFEDLSPQEQADAINAEEAAANREDDLERIAVLLKALVEIAMRHEDLAGLHAAAEKWRRQLPAA